ncbi:MAG: TIGR04255 family protein [bacterium]
MKASRYVPKVKYDFASCAIREIVAELVFESGPQWDFTLPGRLYELVKEDFPEKGFVVITEAKFEPTPHRTEERHIPVSIQARVKFTKANESHLQIGQDLLVLNYLGPNPYWKNVFPLLKKTLDSYQKVCCDDEKGIPPLRRLRLQYLNLIEMPKKDWKISDYFQLYPHVPTKLGAKSSAFQLITKIPTTSAGPYVLAEIRSAKSNKEDCVAVWLILHVTKMTRKRSLNADKITKWFDEAHTIADFFFHEILTEKTLRVILGGQPRK